MTGPIPAVPPPPGPSSAVPPPPGPSSAVPAAATGPSLPGPATRDPGRRPAPPELLPAVPPVVSRWWAEAGGGAGAWPLAGCAAVAVVAGPLVVGAAPGLGLAVALALPWVVAGPALVRARRWADLLLALASVACATVVAWRDAPWLVAGALAAAGLLAVAAAGAARTVQGLLLAVPTAALAAARGLPWLRAGASSALGGPRDRLAGLARSAAVAAVLLLVFGLLFASADRTFAALLPQLHLGRLPAWAVVGVLGALTTAALAQLAGAAPPWSARRAAPARPARRAEWLIPLVALDLLFVAFVTVQLVALVRGHRQVQGTAGLTYAGYAHRGFAQLVVATALTLGVVAVGARRAPRSTARDALLARLVLGVLCLTALGVVASALRRVDLYVEAYGMTRLRLAAITGELFLAAVLLLLLAAGARWRGGWLPRAVLLAGAASVLGLAALNPDARVVQYDAAARSAPLDVGYLQGLSADAVPAIARLDEPLRSCLLQRVTVGPSDGWRGWNLGRSRAAAVLPAPGAACPG